MPAGSDQPTWPNHVAKSPRSALNHKEQMLTLRFGFLRRYILSDRATLYTLAARLVQIVGSLGTVLLIVRHTSGAQQGYYYTLLSLAALQTIFELGFSFVILQMASHESASMRMSADGELMGNSDSLSRLASLFRLILRWYLLCALLFLFVMSPGGLLFFWWKSGSPLATPIFWPWIAAVAALSATIFLSPLFSFFEGCGQIKEVARLRLEQAAGVAFTSWIVISLGYPLYSCAAVNLVWVLLGIAYLQKKRGLIKSLLRVKIRASISWRQEIWPFQWKIAVSWICSYAALQAFTPIMFATRGPLEAGRLGMTLSICGYLQIVALACVTPRAALFGQLVARGQTEELDGIFAKALRMGFLVFLGMTTVCFAAVAVVRWKAPGIAARIEDLSVMAAFIASFAAGFWVQAIAVYLRSFKREPFLWLSLATAAVALTMGMILAPSMGSAGIALALCISNCVFALPWSLSVLKRCRGRILPLLGFPARSTREMITENVA